MKSIINDNANNKANSIKDNIEQELLVLHNTNMYYKKLTFYNKYNFDIWVTFIILSIVSYIVLYYFILNNIPVSYTHLTLPTNREV